MAGKVVVKYLGYLASLYGRQVEVPVDGVKELREVVRIPEGLDPDELIYLVNGRPARLDSKVKPGDVVTVAPHVSGGLPSSPSPW
ncbi:MoaD/ThiS family protein [Stetteria hydrogenophila]